MPTCLNCCLYITYLTLSFGTSSVRIQNIGAKFVICYLRRHSPNALIPICSCCKSISDFIVTCAMCIRENPLHTLPNVPLGDWEFWTVESKWQYGLFGYTQTRMLRMLALKAYASIIWISQSAMVKTYFVMGYLISPTWYHKYVSICSIENIMQFVKTECFHFRTVALHPDSEFTTFFGLWYTHSQKYIQISNLNRLIYILWRWKCVEQICMTQTCVVNFLIFFYSAPLANLKNSTFVILSSKRIFNIRQRQPQPQPQRQNIRFNNILFKTICIGNFKVETANPHVLMLFV